jgi:hypothetical protein
VEIAPPPEEVFATAGDPAKSSLWQDAEEVEEPTDGRGEFAPTPGSGTRVTMPPPKRALEQGA